MQDIAETAENPAFRASGTSAAAAISRVRRHRPWPDPTFADDPGGIRAVVFKIDENIDLAAGDLTA
jgi:hypothetical protein